MNAILKHFMVALSLIAIISPLKASEILKITNGEWPPYLSQKLDHYGVGTRIATEALKRSGYKAQYGFFPWNQAINLAKSGVWPAAVAWSFNEDRDKHFYFSEPLFFAQEFFFHLKSKDVAWKKWEDLGQYKIGATGGYYYGKEFKKAEDLGVIKVSWADSDKRNFQKLLKGEIDLMVINEHVGWFLLKSYFKKEEMDNITYHPKYVRSDPYHLILSKSNPKHEMIVKTFNESLAEIKKEGLVDQWLEALKAN